MLALGDKGALAPLEDGERLFHVGVELVLPLGELRPIAQNLLGGQPPVHRDGGEAQVEVGRFLVHVYHGGEDVPPAHLLLHKSYRFGEVGLYFFSLLRPVKNSGLAVISVSTNIVLSFLVRHPAALMRVSISFRYFCVG